MLDHVLQLTHIAAPRARAQEGDAGVGELGQAVAHLAVPLPVVGQEVVGQQRDVLRPLAEGGQLDRDHPQAVEQVATQNALIHGFLRIAVGRRYGTHPTVDDVLAAMGQVHDARTAGLVRAILEDDLGAALEIARSVADDGVDIARFTRATIDLIRDILPDVLKKAPRPEHPYADLVTEAVAANGVRKLTGAVAELARADFRLDPASPIPLEVACATAILGGGLVPVAAAMPAAVPAGGPQPAGTRPPRAAAPQPATIPGNAPLSPQERFSRDLYEHCKMINPSLAMWLNGSFEVLQMEGDVLELGFQRKMPMDKVDTACRAMVEEQAAAILGHSVTLKVTLMDGSSQPKRETPKGHLAEAARAMGATPVGKDQ